MKPLVRLSIILLLLFGLSPPRVSGGSGSPSIIGVSGSSVDDFDWRDMTPYLYIAAALPGEQGIKALLENLQVLRAYVTSQVQAECKSGAKACDANNGAFVRTEVSKRIDQIVQEGIVHRHKTIRLDYPLVQNAFPFCGILVVKTDTHRDAYLALDFAPDSYHASQVQNKYGAPYDTFVVEWYSIHRYKVDAKNYIARASFKIDPVDGKVLTVAISLKRKDAGKRGR